MYIEQLVTLGTGQLKTSYLLFGQSIRIHYNKQLVPHLLQSLLWSFCCFSHVSGILPLQDVSTSGFCTIWVWLCWGVLSVRWIKHHLVPNSSVFLPLPSLYHILKIKFLVIILFFKTKDLQEQGFISFSVYFISSTNNRMVLYNRLSITCWMNISFYSMLWNKNLTKRSYLKMCCMSTQKQT